MTDIEKALSDYLGEMCGMRLQPHALTGLAKAAIAAMPVQADPVAELRAEITRLTEALRAAEEREKALRSDAERYHWLRDHSCPPHNFYISVPDEFAGQRYAPDDVDAYIDAARQALAGAKP